MLVQTSKHKELHFLSQRIGSLQESDFNKKHTAIADWNEEQTNHKDE